MRLMRIWSCRLSCRKGEEDYALAFAVPNGADGVTYIGQHNPYSMEREHAEDIRFIGNPL